MTNVYGMEKVMKNYEYTEMLQARRDRNNLLLGDHCINSWQKIGKPQLWEVLPRVGRLGHTGYL